MGSCSEIKLPTDTAIKFAKPMNIKRRGQELKLVIGGIENTSRKPDEALIKLISRAFALRTGLETGEYGSIMEFANKVGMDHADA